MEHHTDWHYDPPRQKYWRFDEQKQQYIFSDGQVIPQPGYPKPPVPLPSHRSVYIDHASPYISSAPWETRSRTAQYVPSPDPSSPDYGPRVMPDPPRHQPTPTRPPPDYRPTPTWPPPGHEPTYVHYPQNHRPPLPPPTPPNMGYPPAPLPPPIPQNFYGYIASGPHNTPDSRFFATHAHVNGGREDGQTDLNRNGRNHDQNNNPPGNGGPPPGGDHFDDDDETQARLWAARRNAARNAARNARHNGLTETEMHPYFFSRVLSREHYRG